MAFVVADPSSLVAFVDLAAPSKQSLVAILDPLQCLEVAAAVFQQNVVACLNVFESQTQPETAALAQ